MANFLSNAFNTYKQNLGRGTAQLGGMASLLAGKDLRIGGGSGLGARIAGQSQPFFSVQQPVQASSSRSGPMSTDLQMSVEKRPSPTGGTGQVLGAGTQDTGNTGQDLFGNMSEQAKSQAQIELEQALNEFDYYSEQAQAQKASLGTQRAGSLAEMESALGKSQSQATLSKKEAEESTLSAKSKALSTAQDVQRKNRNVLRALGILSSSAAGEMLAKPMNEYGTQAGELEQGLIKRKQVVEDWLGERVGEHQRAVANLEQQYTELIGNIDRDLRFNDKQRSTAVKAANAALQQRIGEIQQSAMNYQQAAQNYNANIISQIAQIKLYQNPQADVSKLLSTMINPQQNTYTGGQASIYQEDERKKLLSGY